MTDIELDALVAKKIMGYERWSPWVSDWPDKKYQWRLDNCYEFDPPMYSTAIAAAWQVVEKMADDNFGIWRLDGQWEVIFTKRVGVSKPEQADTAPRAICLAALKAVGVSPRPCGGGDKP